MLAGHQQHHGTVGADAANAHHLHRDVLELVSVQQPTPVLLHGHPIVVERLADMLELFLTFLALKMVDQGRVVPDERLLSRKGRELRKVMFEHPARLRRSNTLLNTPARFLVRHPFFRTGHGPAPAGARDGDQEGETSVEPVGISFDMATVR